MSERPVVQAAVGAAVDLAGGLAVAAVALEAASLAVGAVAMEAAGLPVDLAAAVAVEGRVGAVDLAGLALVRQLIQPPAWSSP